MSKYDTEVSEWRCAWATWAGVTLLVTLCFTPEEGGVMLHPNIGINRQDYTVSQPISP